MFKSVCLSPEGVAVDCWSKNAAKDETRGVVERSRSSELQVQSPESQRSAEKALEQVVNDDDLPASRRRTREAITSAE
jgi:hypothetical protein